MKQLLSIIIIPVLIAGISYLLGQITPDIPSGIATALVKTWGYFQALNWIIPVDTIETLLHLAAGFELLIIGYHATIFIYKLIAHKL